MTVADSEAGFRWKRVGGICRQPLYMYKRRNRLWQNRKEIIMKSSASAKMPMMQKSKKHIVHLAKKYHPDMNPGDQEAEEEVQGSVGSICST